MSVPLSSLVSRARTAANMQNGGPWDPGEWDAAVNDAVRAFYVDCASKNPAWKVSTATLAITDSASPHATLPATFMDVYRLTAGAGTSQREPIYQSGDERAEEWARTFRIEGTELWIDPLEQAVDTYELRYNPLPVSLTSSNPLEAELEQFRRYFELHAAIAALTSEESSTKDLKELFILEQQRAFAWSLKRGRGQGPVRPRDVRPRGFLRRRF